ncbi:MAG TPA: hypothetical protein VN380_24160 [Thermoanaerobaculia bacterium]|jgi:hypothetical protein|nr:hypothetical protein [Thermoanaerobaculia bacterium]
MSFAFNASAVAFGGRIHQPSCDVIPSQASVALAPSGGEGYQTVRNFDYKGIITFDEASVYVAGSEHGDIRNALASVTIKNLNVLNLLHADLLSSRITSRHVAGEEEGEITFHGTSAENLRIGGRPVKVNFNADFYSRYPTYATLNAALGRVAGDMAADDGDVRRLIEEDAHKMTMSATSSSQESALAQSQSKTVAQLLADQFCWDPATFRNGVPEDRGWIQCSLADSIDGIDVVDEAYIKDSAQLRSRYPIRRQGYIVKVAEFGSIKIGELIIKPGERRLNLLRFQFGCPIIGDGTAGSVTTNGTDILPKG